MNKVVSHIIVGVVSAAVSGGATFFVTKNILEKKFAKIVSDNYGRAKEHFDKKEAELQRQIDELRGHIVTIVNEETVDDDDEPKEVADDGIQRSTVKISDNIFSNGALEALDSIKKLANSAYGPTVIADNKKVTDSEYPEEEDLIVMNIDDEAYCDPEDDRYQPKFDHIEVTWYEQDDVMCYNDDNKPIYNAEELFGEGHMRFKEGVCFIRNINRRTDYMIIYNSGSFAEEVLGIEPDSYEEDDERDEE